MPRRCHNCRWCGDQRKRIQGRLRHQHVCRPERRVRGIPAVDTGHRHHERLSRRPARVSNLEPRFESLQELPRHRADGHIVPRPVHQRIEPLSTEQPNSEYRQPAVMGGGHWPGQLAAADGIRPADLLLSTDEPAGKHGERLRYPRFETGDTVACHCIWGQPLGRISSW